MTVSDVLTTGEAARMCGVNFRTVLRWIERGWLNSYQLPGRGDHRVPIEELRRFMREYGIPDRSQPAGPPRRALIVDDEPAMAHAIERVLRSAGFDTLIAPSGFEAGAMLYALKPGIMTLDLRMPGMDGIEVLRFLQRMELPSPVKTLVVSGDSDARMQQALALGAAGVLSKPFSNRELLATVNQLYAPEIAA